MTASGNIAIVGAGSFGTAMAATLARNGRKVLLYCRTGEQASAIRATGENRIYFPGQRLAESIVPTDDLGQALKSEIIFLALPARTIDAIVREMPGILREGALLVNLVKGLHERHFTFAKLFADAVPRANYVALKGPTFARPLFFGEWSGLTCGTNDDNARAAISDLFRGSTVDLDHISSAEAVDLISAVKNAYAIVFGIAVSLGLSENTIYMLVKRVLSEIDAIVRSLGFGSEALMSYCGVGDILLTSFCDTSRNRTLGVMIGKGIPIDPLRPDFLAEGVRTVQILAKHVDPSVAPILNAVLLILQQKSPPTSIFEVLKRN